MNKLFFIFFSLFTIHYSLFTIEVGGHLTEDTIWFPENNPHLVTSGVYVDCGATLTILPGTIVKFNSDYYNDMGDDQFYFHNGEEPIAKFIRVEGRIIAEGTEQDSIIFTRIQDEEYYHWGTIYLPETADKSSFKHCLFEFAAFTGFSISEQPHGAISMSNGSTIIKKCAFIDNHNSIYIRNNIINILVQENYFNFYEYLHPNINSSGYDFIGIHYISNIDIGIPLIADNTFKHSKAINSSHSIYFIDNSIDSNVINQAAVITLSSNNYEKSYFFNNVIENFTKGIDSSFDSLYIRNNYFATNGGKGIDVGNAYVEISDNYFEGCDLETGFDAFGKIYNNKTDEGRVFIGEDMKYYNNITMNNSTSYSFAGYYVHNLGNLFINNEVVFNNNSDTLHTNSIILQNEELFGSPILHGTDTFRNCIIDFPLEYPLIDGGGNIWVDSLQAQMLFEDITNGDFHLVEGCLAIDAGFDTTGYYYPFDMSYNTRIWDGDNDGTAIIDIGPYEFGAPQLGKITGNITETNSGELVDYVLLKINNEPGNFTFADSLGYFEIQLPAGTYDIYTERVFYEDNIIYSVSVEDEQITDIYFNMTSTLPQVNTDNENLQFSIFNFQLSNYPNPFNPTTTIQFNLQIDTKVELAIFNVKGQKIKNLIKKRLQKGKHSIVWSGLNEHNKSVSSGIYLYKLKAGNQVSVNRMLIFK
ncbi:MAG: T9SS type A sorting domain-containing protein [Candidatus Cloacimonetes bacterium]|nr:T9SS type A sorting domain-containing protein [Candidatus Cloacimonadota bacterium]